MGANRAIFLDKDGTLVRDIPYNVNPEFIWLSDNIIDGLTALQDHGYKLIVISNQSGVAMGFFDYDQLFPAETKIIELLAENHIRLDGFYYCPHHPQAIVKEYRKRCKCRKPLPGLLKIAAEDHEIDLANSWMIGDILHDIAAGNAAGCKTILINNGNETEWEIGEKRTPDCISEDINAAATYILEVTEMSNRLKEIKLGKQ